MKLHEILSGIDCRGDYSPDAEISDIAYDSRKAKSGMMFVCLSGAKADGHRFAPSAYENGCRVFLCERDPGLPADAQVIFCENTRAALARASCNFFGNPSRELAVVGVTGTKGKTTVTHIIRTVLEGAGIKTGVIGTVGAAVGDEKLPTVNTTPESYELQKLFRLMLDKGCKAAAIEVSSLGLKAHRTDGTHFSVGVFTNLYPDHVGTNEHASLEEYAFWKTQLFPLCRTAVVNLDDAFSEKIIAACPGKVITYGADKSSDYVLTGTEKIRTKTSLGMNFTFTHGKEERQSMISLPGEVNAMNALCAVAVCEALGVKDGSVNGSLSRVFVKGRGEVVDTGRDFSVIIDYAHNGVSLMNIIETAKAYPHGRIISLFGSVGGRTEIRRRELGLVSGRMADLTVITSDDPDFEDPENIMNDIAAAVEEAGGQYVKIADRGEAIRYAVKTAQPNDIVILAGKGHEQFMKIRGENVPFSERAEIEKALNS